MKIINTIIAFAMMPVMVSAQPRNNQRDNIRPVIDRIYEYLNQCTPYNLIDADGKDVKPGNVNENCSFAKGDFGINTYEWGVTYSGMLLAADVFGDEKYADYVYNRLSVLGEIYPFAKKYTQTHQERMRFTGLQNPKYLDECGAMCAAMCKATVRDPKKGKVFRDLLDNWYDFCMNKEYRLSDGILARHRPAENSVWLDDMYMGITPIAFRGKLAESEGDAVLAKKCYEEAIKQVLLFKKYLFVPEKGIYRHGWIEGMAEHPDYHWARANGWAMVTTCEVLDVVPSDTKGWNEVMDLFRTFVKSVTAYQAPNGVWHQLLDKTETYLETSATAMYVYSIAHAISKGWLDRTAYIDVVRSGWNGIAKQVNEKGQVENTCVGTGLGWTNTFYANRPVNVLAAHGYGPVILAGAELAKLNERRNR